ncbi:hypothetical protein RKD37_003664 [Streptomyces ambofaciens]
MGQARQGPIHQSTGYAVPHPLGVERLAKARPTACLSGYSTHKPT